MLSPGPTCHGGTMSTADLTAAAETTKPADVTGNGHAKDQDGVPYCLKHHCRMKSSSGGKKGSVAAYYSCPVPGCDHKAKRIRTVKESIVPPAPLACPRCARNKPSAPI